MSKIKLPPQELAAEKSVLGSILIDEEALFKVVETLVPTNFYDRNHQLIYQAVLDLYNKRSSIDILTLSTVLKKKKQLSTVGGVEYLSELAAGVPTAAHIEEYSSIIKESSIRRSLISYAAKIEEMAYLEGEGLDSLMDEAEQELLKLSESNTKSDFVHVSQLLEEAYDRAEKLSNNPGELRGVGTGFPTLDSKLGGLQKSDLIILAGRPSSGKTSFALDVTREAAVHGKKSIAIFSIEMSSTQLMDRLLSAQARIGLWNLRMGAFNNDETSFSRLSDAMGILSETKLYIDDTPSIGIMELRTKARKLKIEKGLDLIIVDYLQLIRGRSQESRVQEVSEVSRLLKGIARELDVPMLALAQLSRAVEQRGADAKPQLSDLRDSGSIEQDADVVLFVHRIQDPDNPNNQNRKLIIAKHRNGPTGEIDLAFISDRASFKELDVTRG